MNQLRLVTGSNSFRFNLSSEYPAGAALPHKPPSSLAASVAPRASASVGLTLKIRVVDCNQAVYGPSEQAAEEFQAPGINSPFSQRYGSISTLHRPHSFGSKPSIETLVANQGVRTKELPEVSRDALWTLTSSLRNATLETDDRQQWYVSFALNHQT